MAGARFGTMMRQSKLVDIRLAWVNEMSWSALGTKPGGGASSQTRS